MFVGIWISPVALGAVALAAMLGLRAPWWGVLLVVAVSAVLAVAAAMRIGAWYERRGALATATWPMQQQLRAEPAAQVPRAERPAIGPVYHFNFFTPAGDAQAAVIRQAIAGVAPASQSPYPANRPDERGVTSS